jgi:hypothetical protein
MNTDQIGLESRGGNRHGWTDKVINFVFGPVGSLDQITVGVKREADIGWFESSDGLNMKYTAAVHRLNAPDRKITRLPSCGGLYEMHLLAGPRHGWRDAGCGCGCGLVNDRISEGAAKHSQTILIALRRRTDPFPSFVCSTNTRPPVSCGGERTAHDTHDTHEHISINIFISISQSNSS